MAAGIDKEDPSISFHYSKYESFNDFYTFCSFVLAYEEHIVSNTPLKLDGKLINEETVQTRKESTSSSSTDSESSNDRQQKSNKRQRKYSEESQEEKENESDSEDSSSNEYGSDDESWNLVTCYCGRPFAGRPMIECSKCLTWIHLYCARIKKDSVPDYFLCQICKSKTKKKSTK